MKILLLTDGIYPYVQGGMQKHSYNLCRYLARSGVNVVLYHCVPAGNEQPEKLHGFSEQELKQVMHRCFYFPKLDKLPGHYLRESYHLSEIYLDALKTETGIDLVYAQGFTAWALLKSGAKEKQNIPPVIVNFHGLNMFQKAASVKMKLEQYLLRPAVKYNLKHANFVISLGGKLSEILASIIDKNKIIESPVGIDNDWIEDEIVENEVRQLVFIGRNERLKGIKELNKVISRIDDLQFQLHIIGPFNKKDQIVDDRITYHGEIKQEEKVGSILSKMDVLILPSWSEGMPTVILEAMAKGCAIVANDVGAVAELVDDRVGWLCKPGDLNALEMGIRNAIDISDKELSHLKHYAVQKVAQNYTWDKITKRLIDQLKQ